MCQQLKAACHDKRYPYGFTKHLVTSGGIFSKPNAAIINHSFVTPSNDNNLII